MSRKKTLLILAIAILVALWSFPAIVSAQSFGVGSWTQTASYPTTIAEHSCVIASGFVYCIGGYNSSNVLTDYVYYAKLSSSGGIVGGWQRTVNYPTTIWNEACVTYSGYLYCIGGATSTNAFSTTNAVYYAQVNSTAGGIIGGWSQGANYPESIYLHSCIVDTYGYVFCVGGATPSPTPYVFYAKLSNGISSWSGTKSYPTSVSAHSCVTAYFVINNRRTPFIYCIGGLTSSNDFSNLVYYAKISSSGIVGGWKNTTKYPVGAQLSPRSCRPSSLYVSCVGGATASGYTNATYTAKLSATGVGLWQKNVAYPSVIFGPACVIYSLHIYCIGGFNGTGSTNNVFLAPI